MSLILGNKRYCLTSQRKISVDIDHKTGVEYQRTAHQWQPHVSKR